MIEETSHLTKKERYELKKRQKKQTQANKKRQNKIKQWIFFGVIVVLLVIIGYLLLGRGPSSSSLVAPEPLELQANDWTWGEATASARLIEFADFQCPSCADYYPEIQRLKEVFPDSLQIVYRHFPLTSIHPNAMPSARAAEAAGAQGRFWEMSALLFENQTQWSSERDAFSLFVSYAAELELDVAQFEKDYNNSELFKKITAHQAGGRKLGVNSTPSFFLNGVKIANPQDSEEFETLIRTAIANRPLVQPKNEEIHIHADFKVYLAGNAYDFSQEKYQTVEDQDHGDKELSSEEPPVHLHDNNGEIIHIHAKEVTLGDFFESLGMYLNGDCFGLDTGEEYCNDKTQALKLYVNRELQEQKGTYRPRDLDQILLSYGPVEDPAISSQLATLTDKACIYSELCPERGTPPPEAGCIGGLGTGCEE